MEIKKSTKPIKINFEKEYPKGHKQEKGEFNLSKKINNGELSMTGRYINVENVKEFIKLLKEELKEDNLDCILIKEHTIGWHINKLAGEDLK